MRNLLKKVVFERGDANRMDVLLIRTKQQKNRVHTSTELTPIQASLKKNEEFVYQNLADKRKKIKPKFKVKDLVRTAQLKKTFSTGDTTDWSYNLYKITEIINDTIPTYRSDILPALYNEALLKKDRVINERKR